MDNWEPSIEGGPVRARRAWFVALWWVLREIELAGLRSHTSTISLHPDGAVTLFLPISKTDQRGRGSSRTWNCICSAGQLRDGDVDPRRDNCCPACTVRAQVREVERRFGCRQQDEEARSLPLFLTSSGEVPDKAAVVAGWAALFDNVGMEARDQPVELDPTQAAWNYEGVEIAVGLINSVCVSVYCHL